MWPLGRDVVRCKAGGEVVRRAKRGEHNESLMEVTAQTAEEITKHRNGKLEEHKPFLNFGFQASVHAGYMILEPGMF
jgi:hypothetical protein